MAENGRNFLRVRYRTIVLLLAAVVILWSAFSYWSEYSAKSTQRARQLLAPPVGVKCQVVLSAADVGQSPAADGGVPTGVTSSSLSGTLADEGEQWIVLEQDRGKQVWIPRERILTITFEP